MLLSIRRAVLELGPLLGERQTHRSGPLDAGNLMLFSGLYALPQLGLFRQSQLNPVPYAHAELQFKTFIYIVLFLRQSVYLLCRGQVYPHCVYRTGSQQN